MFNLKIMKHHIFRILPMLSIWILLTQQYQQILSILPSGGSGFRTSPSLAYFAFRDTNEFNIYHQSNNTFTYLFSMGKYYTSTTSVTASCLVIDTPPRVFCPSLIIIGANQQTAIRIANISSGGSGSNPLIDNLILTSTPSGTSTFVRMQGNSKALIAITYTTIHVFLWDSGFGKYISVYNSVFANAGSKIIDITDDGAFFVQQIGPANTILRLYKYTAGTYTQTDQYDFGVTLATITKITITGSSSGGSIVVVLRTTGVTYRFDFSSLGILTFILQTSMPFPSVGSWVGLSKGGNYLMQPGTAPPAIRLYQYDPIIFNYLLRFQNQSLVYTPAAAYLQIAEDGSFFYFQSQGTSAASPSNAFSYLHVYYKCTIPFCSHCSGIGFCDICNSGFVLNGPGCTCPQSTILVLSNCVSCNVSFCLSCTSVNVCTSCSEGYEIQGSICSCGLNRTISISSSKCVQCFITDCLRCDVDNVCSEYKPSDIVSSVVNSSNGLSKEVEDLKRNQNIILGLISAMLIIVLVILGIIIMKLKAQRNQQNSDAIPTSQVNQRQNIKEMSQTNLKASISKINVQQDPSINEIAFQEKDLMTRPKKRRARKQSTMNEQMKDIEVIIVNPVIQHDYK